MMDDLNLSAIREAKSGIIGVMQEKLSKKVS
jgi:hypothetical protein